MMNDDAITSTTDSTPSATYAAAGVNIEAGNETVRRIKPHAKRTITPGVVGGIGGFGALFAPDTTGFSEPLLVSSTDGVGTKLKLAFTLDKHDTVGIDLVAMCANDVLCCGAKPLFFLDYFATGKLSPEVAEQVVKGIADGCVESECALIGGETAELPGFYNEGEYDLAGFCVGIVDKPKLIDGSKIKAGDVILGLSSSGLHSNGYSLARKLLEPLGYENHNNELGTTVGEAMLKPTRLYIKSVTELVKQIEVRGLVHITGGGFYENIPRILPQGTAAEIQRGSWPALPLFELLQKQGNVAEREMFTTFNMGIGLVVIVAAEDEAAALEVLKNKGETAHKIGIIVETEKESHVALT